MKNIKDYESFINEDAPMATPTNVPGMGNVTPPGADGSIGSGDVFGNSNKKGGLSTRKSKPVNRSKSLEEKMPEEDEIVVE